MVRVEADRMDRRPPALPDDERRVVNLVHELLTHHDLSDASYHDAASGERGIVALVGLVGYFTMLSMILPVAHTPPDTADCHCCHPHQRKQAGIAAFRSEVVGDGVARLVEAERPAPGIRSVVMSPKPWSLMFDDHGSGSCCARQTIERGT
jgi:hypothetical protein